MGRAGTPTTKSHLLALPTELRLHIYDYIVSNAHAITVTALPLTIFGHQIQDRAREIPIPGLPLELVPVIRPYNDPALLSITKPPGVALDHGMSRLSEEARVPHPAPLALLQTCRLIYDELRDFIKRRVAGNGEEEGLTLCVTYPYGILVLKALCPSLLKQARHVDISGYYVSLTAEPEPQYSFGGYGIQHIGPSKYFQNRKQSCGTPRALQSQRMRLRMDPPLSSRSIAMTDLPPHSEETISAASSALASLTRTIFPPPNPSLSTPSVVKLTGRILYPGDHSYPSVWTDSKGPIVTVMRKTYGGKISTYVYRGRHGSGVELVVRPMTNAREVSSGWKRMALKWALVEKWLVGDSAEPLEGRSEERI